MKKLTVLFAAVLCAAMSFADCNEYGWCNKGEMFLELQKDFNDSIVAHSKYALAVVKEENDSIFYMTGGAWKYWEEVEAVNTPVENANGDFAASTYNKHDEIYSVLRTDKWQWLLDYIKANYKAGREDHADFDETYPILIRCNIQAFFFNSPTFKGGDQNPWSFDYTEAGKYVNWQPTWGKTFCIKEICNPDGWKNKGEMFLGLQADYNAANSENLACAKDSDGLVYYNINGTWTYWEDAEAQHLSMSTPAFFQAATYGKASVIDWLNGDGAAKWGWLKTYIETVVMPDFGWDAAVWRAAISGFFLLSPANPTYPKTADFATAGQYVNFQPAWGQTFCTGGMAHVDYIMPEGAVTNDYGWTNGEDMYQGLAADVYAAKQDAVCPAFAFASDFTGTFGPADPAGVTGVAHDIVTFDLTFFTTEPYATKWGWLTQYMDSINNNFKGSCASSGNATASSAAMRYALAAFFANSQATSWPYSGDYTGRGVSSPAAYMPTWKHALGNPADFAPDYVAPLNAPYKEGESFRGWFLDEIGATEPVDTLSAALTGMTLYGLFGKYVSTIAEVIAQEDNTDAYTGGVVTFINGKNIYIQDVTGGLLIYAKEAPTCTVGQKITVSGKKVLYGGAPEVSNAVVEKVEKGTMPEPLVLQLNEIVAGGLKYFGQMVCVNDIRIAKYDNNGNPFVVSGADTVQCYKMVIDKTEFPVGQRVNLTAIVGYYNAVQFVGDINGFEKIIYQGEKDPSVYETLEFVDEEGVVGPAGEVYKYTITNDWLISSNLGNWDKNKPNQVAEQCRGMAVSNGIIYITYRSNNTPEAGDLKLIRYDAATGEKLADLPLAHYIFNQPAADTTGTRVVVDEESGFTYLAPGYEWNYDEFNTGIIFGPNTDMHVDYDGNILVANLPTEGHVYQIWKLLADENGNLNGEGELVLYVGGNSGITDFAARFPDDDAIRLDRFDLAGSVDGDAWIFAPSQNSSIVYEMDVTDGKWDGECWHVVCQSTNGAFSYSPRMSVVDGGEAFYVDGFVDYPELFDVDGNLLESFRGVFTEDGTEVNPSCVELLYNVDGTASATGICGVHEFEVGGAYFMAMGAGSYEGAYQPFGSHTIYRFKDENRHFYEMQRAWEVSADGFGANKNAQFNYMQVSRKVDEKTTELYLFVAENGIGKYTITADKVIGGETGLKAILNNSDEVRKVMHNGTMYIIRNGHAITSMGQIVK